MGRTKLDIFSLGGKNSIVVGPGRRNPLSAAMLVTCLPHFSPENERLVLKNDAFPSSESPSSRGLFSGAQCLVFVDVIKYTNKRQLQYHSFCPTGFDIDSKQSEYCTQPFLFALQDPRIQKSQETPNPEKIAPKQCFSPQKISSH